jgi:multimeric flavodoxin WrbA
MASPSYWGDITGQMKVFIDRCTPYCNINPNRQSIPLGKIGVAVVVRAGQSRKENENLIATIEHFLGHLDIPLKHQFAVEGISTVKDLKNNPSVLERASIFGREIIFATK